MTRWSKNVPCDRYNKKFRGQIEQTEIYSRCQVDRLMESRAGRRSMTRTLKSLMFILKKLVFTKL